MTTEEKIKEQISQNRIMLYMKGTPSFPQCGFSKTVVDILANFSYEFAFCNILEDNQIREGVKTFFDWPTLPQLIVDGEFVGGCDIIVELYQNGELEEILKGQKK